MVGVTAAGAFLALLVVGIPAPALFAGIFAGLVHALRVDVPLVLPDWTFRLAQGVFGVTIGAQASAGAVQQILDDAWIIALITGGTILIGLCAGRLLAMRRDVSTVTGVFAMTAGGASGAIALARGLGADDRVVGVVQYLRVLMVLLLMPLAATLLFSPATGVDAAPPADSALTTDLVIVAGVLAGGLVATWWVPVPTAVMLGPLLVAGAVSVHGGLGPLNVPPVVQRVAFAAFGIHVGLRFTRSSVKAIGRMVPLVIAVIMALIVGSAGMGVVLSGLTDVDPMTGFLATSPGGLFAVGAIAADSGSDVTFVVAVQLVRLVVILTGAPLAARLLRHSDGR